MASEYNEGGTDEFVIGSCGHFCEACARRDDRIADLQRQLAEAKAEIEAMRPMVERYRWLRSNDRAPSITGIWYGDFTLDKAIDNARKQP